MDHKKDTQGIDKAACAPVSHALVWKQITESGKCSVILEHDAIIIWVKAYTQSN